MDMTVQDALDRIEYELSYRNGPINDALKIVRQCCNKQIPEKYIDDVEISDYDNSIIHTYLCPNCGKWVGKFSYGEEERNNYCSNCGQLIADKPKY